MEFRNESHRMAVKAALIRITADQSWQVMRQFAEETLGALERKALMEDDEDKAKTFRFDARGARKFWESFQQLIETTKLQDNEPKEDDFLEVIM